MRGLDVMDYHRNKVVSMELGTDRMVTPYLLARCHLGDRCTLGSKIEEGV